jgi:hypothetical protein
MTTLCAIGSLAISSFVKGLAGVDGLENKSISISFALSAGSGILISPSFHFYPILFPKCIAMVVAMKPGGMAQGCRRKFACVEEYD